MSDNILCEIPEVARPLVVDYLIPFTIQPNTLILGVGGGYDIYTCWPWFSLLTKQQQQNCVLANISFTDGLHLLDPTDEMIVPITSSTKRSNKNQLYFPEHDLALSACRTIYAIRLVAYPQLGSIMAKWMIPHDVRQVILVDGGVDAMIFGNEWPNGSPLEDTQTVLSMFDVCKRYNIPCRMILSALSIEGVNVDTFTHNWHLLSPQQCFVHRMENDFGFQEYKRVVQSVPLASASVINESIISAVCGNRGRYQTSRLGHRITDASEFPNLVESSCNLWCVKDVSVIIHASKYYQYLLSQPVPKQKPKESLYEYGSIRLAIFWNQLIRSYFRERQSTII